MATQVKAIVDMLLSGVSSMYVPDGYISEMVLPMVSSPAYTGKLAKYGADHLRLENTRAIGKSAYRRAEPISRSQSTYSIEGHGLEGIVSRADYANVQDPYKAEEDEALGLTTLLWIEKESLLAAQILSTSVMTVNTTLSGTSQYSDYINSDPVGDFSTGRAAIVNNCGAKPSKAVFDYQVGNKLRYHPGLLENLGYKYDRPDGLREDELAKAMDVQSVAVGMARYNSPNEGQTDSLAAVWGKDICFLVAPPAPMPYQVSAGYRVQLDGETPRKVSKYPLDNPRGATGILVDDDYQFFISNVNAAYLIKAAIA
jgi:hypothetical protein